MSKQKKTAKKAAAKKTEGEKPEAVAEAPAEAQSTEVAEKKE